MATRTVTLSVVLLMSQIMAQTQVDARICCPSVDARDYFDVCCAGRTRIIRCLETSGCRITKGECPGGYSNHDILEKSADAIKEYCNMGCVSSACGVLTTLQNSDPSAIVNRALEQCTKACSTFCTKGSMTAVETP